MPFEIVEISAAPISALRTSPRPPNRLVPPMTAAAIASISSVLPPAFRSTLFRRGGEHDAAEAGHDARDHEDEDADPRHVDPGPPRRLGVAADRVDVPAERRPLGEERQHEQHRRRRAAARTGRRGPCSGY